MSLPRIRVKAGSSRPAARGALASPEAYDAGDVTAGELRVWHPDREHPDSELGWARGAVTARARDLARNNGYAAGAVQKEIDGVIGANFRPSAKPDHRALGISREAAAEVADEMECAWRLWADDPGFRCDATRTQSWGGMAGLAYRSYVLDGDALAMLHWRADAQGYAGHLATAVRVLDADLLGNPQDAADAATLRGGVEVDAHGAAVAYHLRREHPLSVWGSGAYVWNRIEREEAWGRPRVVHFFDKHRDGQTRGVSRFAPIIEALKMEDKYGRVELASAVLGAILGLFVSSQLDPETVSDLLDDGAAGYLALDSARTTLAETKGLTFGGVRIPVLPPGDDIKAVAATRPNGNFALFEAAVLRRIAAGIGISYEQLSSDWSQVNYSSARAALIDIWRGWTARRQQFARRFCDPIRWAVIEEAIDAGLVTLPRGAPRFDQGAGAWLRAKWIGPGRGFVDPVKEAQAAAMRVALGLETMEDVTAELTGNDYQDNLAQIAQEISQMPNGVLHPAQEKFTELLGGPPGVADTEQGARGA